MHNFEGAELGKILHIEENPESNIIASPDGRVFINLERLIVSQALELMEASVKAKVSGDNDLMREVIGARFLLHTQLEIHKMLVLQAGFEAPNNDVPNN